MLGRQQRFLVTVGAVSDPAAATDTGKVDVLLATTCQTTSGTAQLTHALTEVSNCSAVIAVPVRSRPECQANWLESTEMLTVAMLVMPPCCHLAVSLFLVHGWAKGAAKVAFVCCGFAISIKIICCFRDREDYSALANMRLHVQPVAAGFGVATIAMAYLIVWGLAMQTTLLTAVLCGVIFCWAIASACVVAPLLLNAMDQRHARLAENRNLIGWRATALATVPLLRHCALKDLTHSTCAHKY